MATYSQRMSQAVIETPRWLLLLALVYAPWAYGSTPLAAVAGLEWLLGIALAGWVLSCILRQSWPHVHRGLAVVAAGLLAQAWFMVLNARHDYDAAHARFIPLDPLLPWAPGSLHRALSLETALQVTVMLGAACFACDLARCSIWRTRLLWTGALTGTSVVMLGLVQRMTHAQAIFWGAERMEDTFFATYRYHANAGAFMNLVWPIVAGFTALAFLRNSRTWKKALWTAALVCCLAGVAANTSRAAGALALLLAGLWAGWFAWQRRRGRLEGSGGWTTGILVVLVLLLVAGLAALAGLESTARRWHAFDLEISSQNLRLLASRVCLDMIPEAGWFGFGPGTFQTTFPYFTHRFGDALRGRWLYAHEDYLQTLTEWGYAGGLLWAALVAGGLARAIHRALRVWPASDAWHSERVLQFGMGVGVLGVLLHSAVDFPLQVASVQLYVALVLGLFWGSTHGAAPRVRRQKNSVAWARRSSHSAAAHEINDRLWTGRVCPERFQGDGRAQFSEPQAGGDLHQPAP